MIHAGLRLLLHANPSVVVLALDSSAGSATASSQDVERSKTSCGKISEPTHTCRQQSILNTRRIGFPNLRSNATEDCACNHIPANVSSAKHKVSPELSQIDPADKPEGASDGVQAENDPFVEVSGVCVLVCMGDLEWRVEEQVGHRKEGDYSDCDQEDGRLWAHGFLGVFDVPVRDYWVECVSQIRGSGEAIFRRTIALRSHYGYCESCLQNAQRKTEIRHFRCWPCDN